MAILSEGFLAELNEKVINPAFMVARSNTQGVINVISDAPAVAPEAGYKFGWLDLKIDAGGSTLTAPVTNVATTVPVTNGANFRVGQLVSVKNSDEVMLVTAIVSNDLTVTRGFGGTTAVSYGGTEVITIDSTGREENSLGEDDNMFEPEPSTNYFQTLDSQLTFSRRALAQAQIGNYNDMNAQIAERVNQLTIQLNRMIIRGVKDTATISGKLRTYSGGMNWWLNQTGGLVTDIGAVALTLAKIDDMVEQIVLRGGTTDTIAVNTKQARALQGLINANYQSQRLQENINDRGALTVLSSDLPILGNINRIVVDTNITDSELYMFDSSKTSLVPMAQGNAKASGAWRTLDSTQKGQDGESIRIVGDYGVQMQNWKTNAGKIANIG